MREGELLDGRFEIERLAGSGGMGHVYRARDLRAGEPVALKVLHSAGPLELSRFARETQALAALQQRGIVRYIAHGLTHERHPYLVMEWLDGETLSQYLSQRTLGVEETVTLAMRVSETLGTIHRIGIVHRDLKPSNLLLMGEDVASVTLIDFGVARLNGLEQQLTVPGVIVGTPGYMAPEQARGEPYVDARADVFSLGCVLFKCLIGHAPFHGIGALAVMAKVLLEDPPRLSELRADVPEPLAALIARMMSKSPDERPRDGDAAAAEFLALGRSISAATLPNVSALPPRAPELTTGERKVMCLVIARDEATESDVTRDDVKEGSRVSDLRALARLHQGRLELIDGRSPLIVLSGVVAPTDLAARAARCAIALQRMLGGAPVALATGRAEIDRIPVGELVDRVVRLLPYESELSFGAEGGTRLGANDAEISGAVAVRIDDVTAGLLGARFETVQDDTGRWLRGIRDELDATPQLLGKPTPLVGRERELAMIIAEFRHCVTESEASAVLVTGAAGMGKSRLRHELLRTLRIQGSAVEVWSGRGDPMSAGSAFSLLAQALRRGVGIVEGEPVEVRRQRIVARVGRHDTLDVGRVAPFLGELVGTPFPDDNDVQLQAARRNPMLMGDQIRLAWEDFLRAECSTQPVLLVLEDLHWGDLPTVTMVDTALRHLRDLPFMVLALARPEVRTIFPKLWELRRGHEVRLTRLQRKASEQLVRQVLGDAVSQELCATMVERADGNAFYLEEQIRAVASGKTTGLPETVLAMVQAGLESLDAELRRVLRAASIFGDTFSPSGVEALVGAQAIARLEELARREVILRTSPGGEATGGEYSFRHALVREAAYGMLTERDRRVGHALAGEWLERTGEADPMALAEHFERGGERARAATSYLRAAEQALRGNDLSAAIERADRGAACEPESVTVGALKLVQAEAHVWRGELALAEQRGLEAVALSFPGTVTWYRALSQVIIAAGKLGGFDRVERWGEPALTATPALDAVSAQVMCLSWCATYLSFSGRYVAADRLLRAIDDTRGLSLQAVALLQQTRAIRASSAGDPGACLEGTEAALAAYERAGDRRNACVCQANLGYIYAELGDYAGAEDALRMAIASAERMGLRDVVAVAFHNLGRVLAYRGGFEEARALERRAVEEFSRQGDPRLTGAARAYLAQIELMSGDLAAAEQESRLAAETLRAAPPLRAVALAVLGRVLLEQGQSGDALSAAREALEQIEELGEIEEGESLVRLVHAQALAACGAEREFQRAIAIARERLLARAARISHPVWRDRFLSDVPDNAQTLALAGR